jgi:glyoxylate reductase
VTRPRVFLTQPVAESAIARLRGIAELALNDDPLHLVTKDELIAGVRGSDILFCLLHDAIDAEVVAANPRLKAVASMTITPADIDVAEATRRRIPVTVIPALLLNDATADLAWALLMAAARRVAEGDRVMRSGVFPGSQSCYLVGAAVSGKALGIVGMGGVGKAVARRAAGFAMHLLYHDPNRLAQAEEKALGLSWTPFETLLGEADFVTINARLTSDTRHLFSTRQFGLMKPTAYLVNTARGPIVDEQALVAALREQRIAGAGLDVYEHEPRPHPELLKMDNVVFTPHTGSATRELREAMAHVVVDNIEAVIEGRRPPNCYNPEIYNA